MVGVSRQILEISKLENSPILMWKKKTSQSNSTCFSKRLKAAFLVQQRINRIFRQPKTFQRKEDENSNANPVRLLFKRWRFHPTKSIHFLPTAVQLQCYLSTSISMHKSCTSSYVLGDSPIQKYIYIWCSMSGISKQYLGYMMSCFTKPKQP